jgi:hypothetical protein
MKKVLIAILVGVVLIVFGTIGVAFYTSLPLDFAARILEKFSFKVVDLQGSLAGGYRFASISYSDEFTDFKITDVNFEYSGLWDSLVNKTVIYDAIEIGSAELNIKKHRPSTTTTVSASSSSPQPTDQKDQAGWEKVQTKWKEGQIIRRFEIRKLRFANMKVTAPELPFPIVLKEFKITNLALVPDKAALEEMKILSTFFDMSIAGAEVDGKGIRLLKPAAIVVKTTAWKGFKKNFSLSLGGSFDFATKEPRADIGLFDGHLKAHVGSGFAINLDVNDLTVSDYLENAPAIGHLNLRSDPINFMMYTSGAVPYRGDFTIGPNTFVVPVDVPPNSQANGGGLFRGVYDAGPLHYEAFVKPNLAFIKGASDPWVQIRTNQKIGAIELLSQLYFKKAFASTTPEEQTLFGQVSSAYSVGPPFLPIYAPTRHR